jgi:hypothetical protein
MLKSMIEKMPGDPFPRYGLAMEHKSRGEQAEAAAQFATLLERFPDYTPAYLHAGGTLAALGRKGEAADVLRRGIEACRRKGDHHALGEIQSALADLGVEG